MPPTLTHSRRAFLATFATTAFAGCGIPSGASDSNPGVPASTGTTTRTSEPSGTPPPTVTRSLPLPMSPLSLAEHVLSGGVPKDGIPAIDAPEFEPAAAANSRVDGHSVVFGVERNGVSKAYPQYILVWHEVCNDTLDGDPVSITYCPLTGTALGFDRGPTSVGVSGRLVNNNLIMYDRGTEQWWPQVLATSLPGPWHDSYERHSLQGFRVIWTTWDNWRETHPDTKVLTEDTGTLRNYGSDPYGTYGDGEKFGYYATTQSSMFESLSNSNRYEPKRVVIGARTPDGAVAFLKDSLRDQPLISGETSAGTPVLAVYDSTLDTGYIYENPEVQSYEVADDAFVGPNSEEYPADGLPLDHIHAFDAMWFAWNGFYPQSTIYD